MKDPSNINLLNLDFNATSQFFPIPETVFFHSVGKYRTLYSYDFIIFKFSLYIIFISFAAQYFGFRDGFSSLFNITIAI